MFELISLIIIGLCCIPFLCGIHYFESKEKFQIWENQKEIGYLKEHQRSTIPYNPLHITETTPLQQFLDVYGPQIAFHIHEKKEMLIPAEITFGFTAELMKYLNASPDIKVEKTNAGITIIPF